MTLDPFAVRDQICAEEEMERDRRECLEMGGVLLDDEIISRIEQYVKSMAGRKNGNYSTEKLIPEGRGDVTLRVVARKPVRGSNGEWECCEYVVPSAQIIRLRPNSPGHVAVRIESGQRGDVRHVVLQRSATGTIWRLVAEIGFRPAGRRAGVRTGGYDPGRPSQF